MQNITAVTEAAIVVYDDKLKISVQESDLNVGLE